MRRPLLAALVAIALTLLGASPGAAGREKDDRAAGVITASGCQLTDTVSWTHLPPIYRVDTALLQDGSPFLSGASIISIPVLGQPALTSPQVIETFDLAGTSVAHEYTATFVLKNRNGDVVARTTSPALVVSCGA